MRTGTATHQPQGALVSDTAAPAQVTTLQLEHVRPNPKNVREDMNLTDWFVDSIREYGVVVPVVVLPPLRADGPYELVMGHRRYYGSQTAGRDSISAYVPDPSTREAGQGFRSRGAGATPAKAARA